MPGKRRRAAKWFPALPSAGTPAEGSRRGKSASIAEPIAEKVIQIGNLMDLANRRVDVILDAAEVHVRTIKQNIASTPIAVARLADGADIDHRFASIELVQVVDFFGRAELVRVILQTFGEHAGNVSMALEAIFFDQRKDAIHFALVVDVFGKDVFVEGIARGAVNEEMAVFLVGARPFGQEFPALLAQ